jgi:hypothetical protein
MGYRSFMVLTVKRNNRAKNQLILILHRQRRNVSVSNRLTMRIVIEITNPQKLPNAPQNQSL